MIKLFKNLKNKAFMMALAVIATMSLSINAFAADPETYDMVGTMTTSLTSLSTQIFAIIAVVVPIVLGILGAKIAITKGISIFKSLVSKG